MNQTFVKSVTEQLPQLGLLQYEPMKKHTTFRIGGPADYYAEPDMSRISKLIEMAKACDMPLPSPSRAARSTFTVWQAKPSVRFR